jgi:hypothetical protein
MMAVRAPTGADPAALSPRSTSLWFGLLGGAAAWTAHELLSYLSVSLACHGGDPGDWKFHLVQHGLTLLTALGALAAGVAAYRTRQRVAPWMVQGVEPPGTETGNDPGEARRAAGRTHHLAELGMVIDGFFLLAILFGGAANFFVRPCL